MFALALVLLAVLAFGARLVTDIRQDRPVSPPRSHSHEIDTQAARLMRLV